MPVKCAIRARHKQTAAWVRKHREQKRKEDATYEAASESLDR